MTDRHACAKHGKKLWAGYRVLDPDQRGFAKIALHHYTTRSWEDFQVKMRRGGGTLKKPKTKAYFLAMQECALPLE